MSKPIRFIHISDTHIGSTREYKLRTIQTYTCAEKIINHINNLTDKPDFVIHTGDVTSTKPLEEEYVQAKELFSHLHYPIFYVTGNHDRSFLIKKHLTQGDFTSFVSDEEKNSYYFDIDNYRFITLDGRGPDKIDPRGTLSNDQFEALEIELKVGRKKLIISIHYPPVEIDSIWIKSNMLLNEGDRFHTILSRYPDRILCVLFGHIHRGMQIHKDGIFLFFSWKHFFTISILSIDE